MISTVPAASGAAIDRLSSRSMKYLYSIVLTIAAATALGGCFSISRVETDIYTITQRDTTIREDVRNVPGERDNGTIYPSTRTVEISRNYIERDSVNERLYPAFLRFGGFEAAGLIGGGASTKGSGHGLFGLYDLITAKLPSDTKIFGAYMYRLMPYEVRLRVFEDDPNWTVGTAAYETFIVQKDSNSELASNERLQGYFPLYVRKRFFLRDKPPYAMVVPFLGIGLVPSQYVNFGATFDVGSYGGFNLRAYAGYVAGTSLILQKPESSGNYDVSFPYVGIGISTLDFVNKTEELFVEWKDHKHNAIEVSVLNFDLVYSATTKAGSIFKADSPGGRTKADSTAGFPSGAIVRLGTATYPLPIADGHIFVGTSLFNLLGMARDEVAFGFLPIRAGYRMNLLEHDLNFEPFAEFTYYPSTAFQIGARASLKVYDWAQLNVVAGYVSGSLNLDVLAKADWLKSYGDFSSVYIGVGIGVGDVFHTPEEVLKP
jgi:hypothetical protein